MIVTRPFAGLAAECDLVALRELLPSATAPLPLATPLDVPVTVASVLPGACAALVRPDGEIWLGMQVQTRSGDLSVDLARALAWARTAEPGVVAAGGRTGRPVSSSGCRTCSTPRRALDITVHRDFAWWLVPDDGEPSPEVAATLERANKVVMPTEPVAERGGVLGRHRHQGALRWVRPEPEDALVAAIARLQARGELTLGRRQPDSRYAGSFRAHGLLVPVWDLDRELHPKEWAAPVTEFAARLERALADAAPLTDAERRARDALAGKQVTLR